jgi:mannose-6-phosphate isomerase-like protein (cupin superfamily)
VALRRGHGHDADAIDTGSRPSLVAHADWGSRARSRWIAAAETRDGGWRVGPPRPVGEVSTLLPRLAEQAGGGCALVGFDFPIGLPAAYAERAGITSFREVLPELGRGEWARFFDVAERPGEISPRRPFYPRRPGGTSREHLHAGLGLDGDALLRRCERATATRRAAAPLFWTLGAQQVGAGAIVGWRDVLQPALAKGALDVALWPFDGRLEDLFAPGRLVVAETYPTDIYGQLGISFAGRGKHDEGARAALGEALVAWAGRLGLELEPELDQGLRHGFKSDDAFDAVVGLFGMLNVVSKYRAPGEPDDERIRGIEGWMLGHGADVEAIPATRGWTFSSLEELGEGPGFRKVRQAMGIRAFGVNVIVIPPGVVGRPHFHEEQDELYFVHAGLARFALPGEVRELGPGGLCHVESTTPRQVTSVGDEDLVLLVVGAKDGYVGRDGQLADPSKLG